MSSDAPWLIICEPEVATSLSPSHLSAAVDAPWASPIDDYYEYVEHLLTLGSTKALEASDTLGRLLLLGLVSGVETYFRSIFAGLLQTCPLCRVHAADQQIPYGAVAYYGVENLELGLFDSISLAGSKELRNKTQKLLGLEVSSSSSVDAALREFDKLCQLRHAAVHSRGTLGRGNASALQIDGRHALKISFAGLQDAGLIAHSMVRAFNRFLHARTVARWIDGAQFSGSWEDDKVRYQPLYDLFYSTKDGLGPSNAYHSYRGLRARVLG